MRPMPALWQASSALFRGESFSSQGLYWSMIASMKFASAAAWRIAARSRWWQEKPKNFTFPVFLIASIPAFSSGFLTSLIASSAEWLIAQSVDEEEVDLVRPERREPLVDVRQHLLGGAPLVGLVDVPELVLGDQEDLLADLRRPAANHFLRFGSEP